jgi:putative hemolysin
MKAYFFASFCILNLVSCAAVFTDASDANHVTYINSNGESIEQLTSNANSYCAQFGKTASFRSSDSQFLVVFDCKIQR